MRANPRSINKPVSIESYLEDSGFEAISYNPTLYYHMDGVAVDPDEMLLWHDLKGPGQLESYITTMDDSLTSVIDTASIGAALGVSIGIAAGIFTEDYSAVFPIAKAGVAFSALFDTVHQLYEGKDKVLTHTSLGKVIGMAGYGAFFGAGLGIINGLLTQDYGAVVPLAKASGAVAATIGVVLELYSKRKTGWQPVMYENLKSGNNALKYLDQHYGQNPLSSA